MAKKIVVAGGNGFLGQRTTASKVIPLLIVLRISNM